MWPGLSWSTDTKAWKWVGRRGEALIPLSEVRGSIEWGCIFAAAAPIVLDDEIRIYYSAQPGKHGWNPGHLCLATLRPDGWAGYEQASKDKPAVITTTAIPYAAQKIRITGDVESGGSIKVSIVDEKGRGIVEADLVSKTMTDGHLTWRQKTGADRIRLKFEINNAKLYSFSFAE